MVDRIYPLRQMPISCCPKGVPVLVSGGVAMLKTGGVWVSGMSEPAFTRELNWKPEWWASIPQENDPLPSPRPTDKPPS
jgi:GTP-dependent phosphoenolpyruvate carboxykinase